MRVVLIDEHVLFREGLQSLLPANGIEVAGTARGGTEALELVRRVKPDVVLMNIAGAGPVGLTTIRRLKAKIPPVKVVVLADSDADLLAAVRNGACGYLTTGITGKELCQKLLALERGEAPFSPGLTSRLLEGFAQAAEQECGTATTEGTATGPAAEAATERLTARQKEILELVAQGMTYREAGAALGLTERTVKYHMGNIMRMLRLKKREQVIAHMLRRGL